MSDLGNKEIFAKNLKFYMELNKKDRNDIARDLELPYTTVTSWYNAEFYPRIDKIQLLANYFGIQKSDLVEDNSKRNSTNDFIQLKYGSSVLELLSYYDKLNDLGKSKALENMKDLSEITKYTEKKTELGNV